MRRLLFPFPNSINTNTIMIMTHFPKNDFMKHVHNIEYM